MTSFFLVDCNNFFVSCERVFKPNLQGQPVVVLSNNDGCVISRSNEAKKLGIPMGAPLHLYQHIIKQNKIVVLSSNFNLYRDMSRRIMQILKEDFLEVETYSIDEAFIKINQNDQNQQEIAYFLRDKILKFTGIPVSIGIAKSKTLAKIAGSHAKKTSGVFCITDPEIIKDILHNYPIEEIWGIGRNTALKMRMLNIATANDLSNFNPQIIRKEFSIIFEKIIHELNGISCLDIQLLHKAKKSVRFSRSFGQNISSLEILEQALSEYVGHAAAKLRKENLKASQICVCLRTNSFQKNQDQYRNSLVYQLPFPTSSSLELTKYAKYALNIIFKPNYSYHKLGILLFELNDKNVEQLNVFRKVDSQKTDLLMNSIDQINQKMGKNTIFIAAQGVKQVWQTKRNMQSPEYTTKWSDLPKVH